MYFRRKIDAILDQWLSSDDLTPSLAVGIRQCSRKQ